jgi:hypothetical protein
MGLATNPERHANSSKTDFMALAVCNLAAGEKRGGGGGGGGVFLIFFLIFFFFFFLTPEFNFYYRWYLGYSKRRRWYLRPNFRPKTKGSPHVYSQVLTHVICIKKNNKNKTKNKKI